MINFRLDNVKIAIVYVLKNKKHEQVRRAPTHKSLRAKKKKRAL